MQLLTSLIGGSGNMYLNAALALGVVVILIILGLWGLKLVFRASTTVAYGRNRRLAVVDSLPVDGKRQLLIVRRDNVEHLILTGGPQDVVVETGFVPDVQPVAARPLPVVRRSGPLPAPAAPGAAASGSANSGPQRAAQPQRVGQPQRAAQPQRPRAPETVLAHASNDANPVRSSLERLRDIGRPGALRRPGSLRHTGLMRPVNRMEPALQPANTDNSIRSAIDSATTSRAASFGGSDGSGQAFGRGGDPGSKREEGYEA